MKRRHLLAGTFLSLALCAGFAQAGPPTYGCYYPPIPHAPDMCNPGYYWTNNCGMTYGPAHCILPPYHPFQGMVPCPPPRGPGGPGGAGPGGPNAMGSPTFPTHPYARSPRDFFMYYDKDEPYYAPGSYAPGSAAAYSPSPYFAAPSVPAVAPAPAVPPAPPPAEERPR